MITCHLMITFLNQQDFCMVLPLPHSYFYDDMCIAIVIISIFLRGTHLKRLIVR